MGDAAEGEESTEATAGLSLTMMDVLLRPVEFFRGMSGLMTAVWNAPSEPVSALQVQWFIIPTDFNFINKDGNLFVSSRIDCFVLVQKHTLCMELSEKSLLLQNDIAELP